MTWSWAITAVSAVTPHQGPFVHPPAFCLLAPMSWTRALHWKRSGRVRASYSSAPHTPDTSGCSQGELLCLQAIPSKGIFTASFQWVLSTSSSQFLIPLLHTEFPKLLESITFCISKTTSCNLVSIILLSQSINPLDNSKHNRVFNDCVLGNLN